MCKEHGRVCACTEKAVKNAHVQENMTVCACTEKDVKKCALVQKQVAELKKHAHAYVQENMAECAHAQKKM